MERARSKELEIKAEAQAVIDEQNEANRKLKEKFAGYGQELENEMKELTLKCDKGKLSNLEAESRHKGLQLGDYRPPDQDELNRYYQKSKQELLKRQDELRKWDSVGDGNWINHMQSIDKWNWCWINDTSSMG